MLHAVLGILACALPPVGASGADVEVADPWTAAVSARIRHDAHGFAAVGDGFSTAGRGITGRFDFDGAHLVHDDRDDYPVTVRARAWGRRDAAEQVSSAAPVPGDCVGGMEDPEGQCVRRLEFVTRGFTEWWANMEGGLEQGWTIDAAPGGSGPVVVDIGVDGASVTVGDGEVWLVGDDGEAWTVSGLYAWGADGEPLDARFDMEWGGFRVTVEDEGARYPITIDPVYSTASATLGGESTSNAFGYSVSAAGDVDGDGYDDVIVGASGTFDGHTQTGRAYVFLGSASGLSTVAGTTLTAVDAWCAFGGSVSGAGDVNGDGYDDVIVGAKGYSTNSGRAYVYLGSASGVSATVSTTLLGEENYDYFGHSVSGAGDVNGDGYDDVIVGADQYGSNVGRAYVYLGSSSGLVETPGTVLDGEATTDHFGGSVSTAGDVDNDGYDDVIVGAYGYSAFTGRAYVYLGSSAGTSGTAGATLTGVSNDTYFGVSVSDAGDVDADGYGDVIVGAYRYGLYSGRAYVYAGSSGGVSSAPGTTLVGDSASYFGYSVSGAGDVDGDGYADVTVGAYRYSDGPGALYVYPGSSAGVSTTASTAVSRELESEYLGYSVSGAGDVNGDGYGDVIAGAYGYNSATGRADLYEGTPDADADGYAYSVDCDDEDALVHPGADELCNRTDDDCDGAIDEDAVDMSTLYVDADGDFHGDPDGESILACPDDEAMAPWGYAWDDDDCDDTNSAASPGLPEQCDGIDNDCDGLIDESGFMLTRYYQDLDGDGYGTWAMVVDACDAPDGYASNFTDCNDADPAVNPAATEICDGIENDCSNYPADSDAVDEATWYADIDGDSFGDMSVPSMACDQPSGSVSDSTDCDDANPAIHPAATESPGDSVDQDCDGSETCYLDADGDGYRPDASATASSSDTDCSDPGEALATAPTGDCDDTNTAYNPAAAESDCTDPNDYNCDGSTAYANVDGDTFAACEDCNDADSGVFPGAVELVGDRVDQDCDGVEACFVDADDDGYRPDTLDIFSSANIACDGPGEAVATDGTGDCADGDATVHPTATELPGDGVDQDCDGLETCFVDADDDGYRPDASATASSSDTDCSDPGEALATALIGDCDDTNTAYNPSAEESDCTDPNDYNCDGSTQYADADADGFAACQDCDDAVASVNADALEACNGLDDDCEGTIDEGAVNARSWYADSDGDGYTDPMVVVTACEPPEGFAAATLDDCDDSDPTVYPGAEDPDGDGIDQDCGGISSYPDAGETADMGRLQGGGGLGCTSGQRPESVAGLALGALALRRRRAGSAT